MGVLFVIVVSIEASDVFVFAYFAHIRDHGAFTVKSSGGLHKEIRPGEFKSEMGCEVICSQRWPCKATPLDLQNK